MSEPDKIEAVSISADDFFSYPWQDELSKVPRRKCKDYYEVFVPLLKQAFEKNDTVGVAALRLLNEISLLLTNYDFEDEPYLPIHLSFSGGKRTNLSFSHEDIDEHILTALQEAYSEISDPELWARIADILWLRKRDFRAVKNAVPAFVEAAKNLEATKDYSHATQRLRRAVDLSSRKGFEEEKSVVHRHITSSIESYKTKPNSEDYTASLLEVVLKIETERVQEYANLAKQIAVQNEAREKYASAHRYWIICASYSQRAKDELATKEALIMAAETFHQRAEAEYAKGEERLPAAEGYYQQALEALKKAGAPKERVEEALSTFRKVQKQVFESACNYTDFSFSPLDNPAFRANAEQAEQMVRKHLKGSPFREAIYKLAQITDIPSMDELAKLQSGTSLMDSMVVEQKDYEGKTTDTIASADYTQEESAQRARKKSLESFRLFHLPFEVCFLIEPARLQILGEHPLSCRSLGFLVANSPFVVPGHETTLLRGIYAGLHGDWLVASHLIIPQLEANIRYVLKGHVETSKYKEGVQMDRDINELLWEPKLEEMFGKETLFVLRGLLIERFGGNLRNELAHGLISHDQFFSSPEVVYLWWLTLRICVLSNEGRYQLL